MIRNETPIQDVTAAQTLFKRVRKAAKPRRKSAILCIFDLVFKTRGEQVGKSPVRAGQGQDEPACVEKPPPRAFLGACWVSAPGNGIPLQLYPVGFLLGIKGGARPICRARASAFPFSLKRFRVLWLLRSLSIIFLLPLVVQGEVGKSRFL